MVIPVDRFLRVTARPRGRFGDEDYSDSGRLRAAPKRRHELRELADAMENFPGHGGEADDQD